MHSPPPSPTPSSSASLSRQTLANRSLDHMTHNGSAEAGPSGEETCTSGHPALHAEEQEETKINTWETHDRFGSSTSTCPYFLHVVSDTIPDLGSQPKDQSKNCSTKNPSSTDGDGYPPSRDSFTGASSECLDARLTLQQPLEEHTVDELVSGCSSSALLPPDPWISSVNNHASFEAYQPDAGINIMGYLNHTGNNAIPEHSMMTSHIFGGAAPNWFYNDQGHRDLIDQPPFPAVPLYQTPFQPNLNIPSFPFGPANPIQQRTQCPWLGCSESFGRSTDVQRHVDAVHLNIKYHCFWIGCPNNGGKGYCRLEKLRSHQRQRHGFALM